MLSRLAWLMKLLPRFVSDFNNILHIMAFVNFIFFCFRWSLKEWKYCDRKKEHWQKKKQLSFIDNMKDRNTLRSLLSLWAGKERCYSCCMVAQLNGKNRTFITLQGLLWLCDGSLVVSICMILFFSPVVRVWR